MSDFSTPDMAVYLGITLFAFFITAIAIIPFIDFLYRIRFYSPHKSASSRSVPVGGGVLLVGIITLLFFLLFPVLQRFGVYITSAFPIKQELNIIFTTLVSFGLLGLMSDMVDIFHIRHSNFIKQLLLNKSILQLSLSLIVASLIFYYLNIQIINVPFLGVIRLGLYFIPIATVIIFLFSHSLSITDSLDGMSAGTLLISLLTFWGISFSVLDTPLSVFIALWIGCLLSFLYFNVYPARILLGQTGALAFGATLAVTGLLLGKIFALFLIGGVFIIESTIYTFRYFLKFNTFQEYLIKRAWPEPKIVMRVWLVGLMLSLLGLWFALN